MVTRRQFGLWAAAAILVVPSVGVAGEVQSALEGITLTGKLGKTDGGGFAIDLEALNASKSGATVRISVVSAKLSFGGEEVAVAMVWMNDQNPMSRRIRMPSFVDLPSDKPTLAGKVNVLIDDGLMDKPDGVVELVLMIWDDKSESRQIALPPIAVTKATQDNS